MNISNLFECYYKTRGNIHCSALLMTIRYSGKVRKLLRRTLIDNSSPWELKRLSWIKIHNTTHNRSNCHNTPEGLITIILIFLMAFKGDVPHFHTQRAGHYSWKFLFYVLSVDVRPSLIHEPQNPFKIDKGCSFPWPTYKSLAFEGENHEYQFHEYQFHPPSSILPSSRGSNGYQCGMRIPRPGFSS